MKQLFSIMFIFIVLSSMNIYSQATIQVPADFATIQEALVACGPGDTILVSSGTYNENLVWPATQNICLMSDSGAIATIIDGGGTGRVITILTGVDATTIVDGFTIQNGYDLEFGAGIFCRNGSSPTIKNNVIKNNLTTYPGGAGIGCSYGSSPLIAFNTISENNATTGGGGGILVAYDSHPIIDSNVIKNNYCDMGGAGILIYENCSATINGNYITENEANGGGGGVALQTTTAVLTNNTITYNTGSRGGIACGWSDASIIENNEISYNNPHGIFCKEGSTPIINNNNICDNDSFGVNNIDPNVTVDARYNWWGHESGPYHPTLNPSGLGDEVSYYVLFTDWLPGPIPVELKSFTATLQAGTVILNWTTATETNNSGFEVERKLLREDGMCNWTIRGFKHGYGTTTQPHTYSFMDDIIGVNAVSIVYRLKQIDFDGSFEYSEEIQVTNLIPAKFVLEQNYPNPFNPSTTISYSLPVKSKVNLKVFDATGGEVHVLVNQKQDAGNYKVIFNGSGLASGVYFYRLQTNKFTSVKKLVLMK